MKLIGAKWVITMDPDLGTLEDGGVLIEGSKISEVGPWEELRRRSEGVFYHDSIIMPGLINAHTHAAMVALRGLADDLALDVWLTEYIWPAEAKVMQPDAIRDAVLLAAAEMVASGTTLFCDMYFWQEHAAQALADTGIRAVLAEGVIDFPTPDAKNPKEGLEKTRQLLEATAKNPKVKGAVALHAPYSTSPWVYREGLALAQEFGVPLLTHLAETKKEVEEIKEKYGRTPAQHLADLGVVGPWLVAAHGVWLTDHEAELLARAGAHVVHCPESNMKLASGRARVWDYLRAGLNVALGTDGAASNNDLCLLGEMRTAALLAKLGGDPSALPADEVLRMATLGGARALGLDEHLGSLTPGKEADLVVLDAGTYSGVPCYNPESQVVYALGRDSVRLTLVAGEEVYRDGEARFLSRDEAKRLAKGLANRVKNALTL